MATRIIYGSTATQTLNKAALGHLLNHARRNNNLHSITGFLIYDGEEFMQVIEGPPKNVKQLFNKVAADERHTDVEALFEEDNVPHAFSSWSMAYLYRESEDSIKLGGSMSENSLRELTSLLRQRDSMCVSLLVDKVKDLFNQRYQSA